MTDAPKAMIRGPLAPAPPRDPDVIAIVEAQLDKGLVDAAITGRYFTAEALAARAARDAAQRESDWPALGRYRAANVGIDRPDLVMIGDSLTEIWGLATPDLFGPRIANRGISGQTSAQILLRFTADVIDLKPARVHIMCGTNDIAGNTGPNQPEDYQRNIRAMVDLATAQGIGVMLASIPPAEKIFWSPDADPSLWIPELNRWLREFSAERGAIYVDYHAALDDGNGALKEEYSADGVHVTRAAYRVMRTILAEASGLQVEPK